MVCKSAAVCTIFIDSSRFFIGYVSGTTELELTLLNFKTDGIAECRFLAQPNALSRKE